MISKRWIGMMLILFVLVSVSYAIFKEYNISNSKSQTLISSEQGHKIMAYYFHTTDRCVTCKKIEAYSEQVIHLKFGEALQSGRLVWKLINVDEPGSAHYVTDYQLTTKSVVLVELQDGVQKKWKVLDRAWQVIKDENEFKAYIQNEVAEFGKDFLI